MKIANIHRYFDAEGNYHGPADHIIKVNGEEHDLYDYAKQHDIELPGSKKSKKHINTDIQEESYGDMGEAFDEGSAEEHGDGDSEGSE
jgi:hypothetical protein